MALTTRWSRWPTILRSLRSFTVGSLFFFLTSNRYMLCACIFLFFCFFLDFFFQTQLFLCGFQAFSSSRTWTFFFFFLRSLDPQLWENLIDFQKNFFRFSFSFTGNGSFVRFVGCFLDVTSIWSAEATASEVTCHFISFIFQCDTQK